MGFGIWLWLCVAENCSLRSVHVHTTPPVKVSIVVVFQFVVRLFRWRVLAFDVAWVIPAADFNHMGYFLLHLPILLLLPHLGFAICEVLCFSVYWRFAEMSLAGKNILLPQWAPPFAVSRCDSRWISYYADIHCLQLRNCFCFPYVFICIFVLGRYDM